MAYNPYSYGPAAENSPYGPSSYSSYERDPDVGIDPRRTRPYMNVPHTTNTPSSSWSRTWSPGDLGPVPDAPAFQDHYGPFLDFLNKYGPQVMEGSQEAFDQNRAQQEELMGMKRKTFRGAEGGYNQLERMNDAILGGGGDPGAAESFGFLAPQVKALQQGTNSAIKRLQETGPHGGGEVREMAAILNAGQAGAAGMRQNMLEGARKSKGDIATNRLNFDPRGPAMVDPSSMAGALNAYTSGMGEAGRYSLGFNDYGMRGYLGQQQMQNERWQLELAANTANEQAKQAKAELDEAIRSHKSQEEIERRRTKSQRAAANAQAAGAAFAVVAGLVIA